MSWSRACWCTARRNRACGCERHPGRPARGRRSGVSVRAQLLHRLEGAQRHHAPARAARGWTLNEYRLGPRPMIPQRRRNAKAAEPIPEIREERNSIARSGSITSSPSCARTRRIRSRRGRTLPQVDRDGEPARHLSFHTTASDGRNSLEEMAAAAQELGLQYLGIADHSRSSFQAHGLDEDAAAPRRSPRFGELNRSSTTALPPLRRHRMRYPPRRHARLPRRNARASSITSSRACTTSSTCPKPR